ncbi:DegT/DnrJ/EryC1/StrS family aminotransferase [Patescibacteria group bacterium]|nr:DegT/DnrJ/EryC1/StrS family aminotransferase [Patescibacteria group bacterium]
MKIIKEKPYKIPLFHPYVSEKAIKEVAKVLRTKFIGQGPRIPEFEQKFAKKFKMKYAVAVNSCTAALHLAYILAGVKRGDEVVGPLFTCSATWHPVLQLGAKPVFVDIKDDFTIDPKDLERKITKRTKAIVVIHYGGCMCDMEKIMKIAKKYKLLVIEDAAQSLGAKYKGKYAGTIGDYGCFSFQAIKYMTTIDGGMLVMKDKKDYEKAKRIRWFGIDRDLKIKKGWQQFKDWERREMTFDVWEIGYKYHMNNFNAVMGMVHMQELDKILAYQKKLNNLYRTLLKNIKGIEFLPQKPDDTHWLMTILVDRRDDFAKKLKNAGIETNTVHIRNDVYKVFKSYANGSFPNMDKVELKYLCLPMHFKITPSNVKEICNIVKKGW